MGWLFSTLLLLSHVQTTPGLLPSRDLALPPVVVSAVEPANFDLLDFRDEVRDEVRNVAVEDRHSRFQIKRHIGASVGYDNTIVHGSVGLYLTVAELGRWNFGIPSVAFGVGRYPIYDRARQRSTMQSQPTVFVSVASVHYRMGYMRTFGVNAYVNLEQVYDLRHNMMGSQFGFSFSTK